MNQHLSSSRARPAGGAPAPGTFSGGSVLGFPVRLHWTWLPAVLLVAWSVEGQFLAASYPGWTTGQRWLVGISLGVLVFAGILAHELGHAWLARRRGYRVTGITLFIMGGVSNLEEEPRRAGDEFAISLAGPLVSLALGLGFGALWLSGQVVDGFAFAPLAGLFAAFNLLLALFNLLPAFPLDGGRMLRAALWGRRGDLLAATRQTANASRVVGVLLIGGGIALAAGPGLFTGIWLALTGWLIWGAAGLTYGQLLVRHTLQGVPARALVERDVPRVAPDMTLSELAGSYRDGGRMAHVFVAPGADGDVLGLVSPAHLKAVPREQWAETTVFRAMTPRHKLVVAGGGMEALEALQLMAAHGVEELPVFEGREALGLLTRARVAETVRLRGALPAA